MISWLIIRISMKKILNMKTISVKELIRILSFNNFEWHAYMMDKKGRKQRPSFSNNWPDGVRD